MGARDRECWARLVAAHGTLHETPLCRVAAARQLWGEPRCQRGGEPAQARATGGGGGACERTWSGRRGGR
eukprot:3162783-Prymnesium_polylepis.1